MEWYWAFLLLIGLVIGLMVGGLPVAFAFLATNVIGVYIFLGGSVGLDQLVLNISRSISSYYLVPVPLFILMGEIFFHTGVSHRMFYAIDRLFGGIPGRLCYVAVAGGTMFASMSGSSMANTAMMGSMLVPEMMKRGYDKSFSMGPIMATGGLAILIPPSALAVLLGSLAQINIGALLLAGILPALLLAAMFIVYIFVRVRMSPALTPQYPVEEVTWGEAILLILFNLIPTGFILFCVVGVILLGIATPTESAAFGVLGVLVVAAAFRSLSVAALITSLTATLKVTVMLFTILLSSLTFSQILAFSGASAGLIEWASQFELGPIPMLLIMFTVLMFLGMFLDQVSQIMLTIPIFMPLSAALGFDPVWFGIVIMLSLELSTMTPPFGLVLFVMLGVAPKGTTLEEVALSAAPYLCFGILLLAILILFPQVALFLPSITS